MFCVVKVLWRFQLTGVVGLCENEPCPNKFWMLFETNAFGSCSGFMPGTPKKMDLIVVFLFAKEDRSHMRNNNRMFLFHVICVAVFCKLCSWILVIPKIPKKSYQICAQICGPLNLHMLELFSDELCVHPSTWECFQIDDLVNPITSRAAETQASSGYECSIPLDLQNHAGIWNLECVGNA